MDMGARLSCQNHAVDGIYRMRYFAGWRQVTRMKQNLVELNGSAWEVEEYVGVNGDNAEKASALAMLATEATVFALRVVEKKMRELMERVLFFKSNMSIPTW